MRIDEWSVDKICQECGHLYIEDYSVDGEWYSEWYCGHPNFSIFNLPNLSADICPLVCNETL